MDIITVRFTHLQTHTPVMEVKASASATVGALRELLIELLGSEEHCMMRVFTKWHVEVVLAGGQNRLVELTAADEDEPLHSLGISHLSEVHLEGPLTGDSIEGVGQALGLMWGQMQASNTVLAQLAERTDRLFVQQSDMIGLLRSVANTVSILKDINLLPHEAELADKAIQAEEGQAFARLQLLCEGEAAYHNVWAEATAEIEKIYVPWAPCFLIDQTTPHVTFAVSDDGTTATKSLYGNATFRASEPLSLANRRWAVRMMKNRALYVGLLPKLSVDQVAKIEKCNIKTLGGWGIEDNGDAIGDWHCERGNVTFKEGDLVTFDFSFAAKTLTISCNGNTIVGHIPSIKDGDQLYPAVSMFSYIGYQIGLERHPN